MDYSQNNHQQIYSNGNAAQPCAPEAYRSLAFQFTGNATEYFRIWVVNTLLTIVTLGVYSAWAKVRTKQYFYRNTLVDGASFDYLADPIPILKGRVIVAAALGVVAWSRYYSPKIFLVVAFALFLATPWVVAKSLAFNARNSAYRNIRFAFPGRVGEAFGVYLKTTLVHLVSCGLGYPWAQWTLTRFIVWRHYYGDLQFTWHTECSKYYRVYLVALALVLPAYVLMFGATVGLMRVGKEHLQFGFLILGAVFFVYLLLPTAYVRAHLSNLLYGGLAVDRHRFTSTQQPLALLKLYAVNAIAIVGSVGLLIPWATIRLAKYRAETLTLHACGTLYAESLLTDNTGAVGEGMTDLGDFDLGIGV